MTAMVLLSVKIPRELEYDLKKQAAAMDRTLPQHVRATLRLGAQGRVLAETPALGTSKAD